MKKILLIPLLLLISLSSASESIDIFTSVYTGDSISVKKYIQAGGSLDIPNKKIPGASLLLTAIDNSRFEIVSLMMKENVPVKFREISHSIGRGEKEISLLLLSNTKSMTQKEKDQLLNIAASGSYEGYIKIIEELVKLGCNPTTIIYGEGLPNNSINSSFRVISNKYSKDAEIIFDYLVTVSQKILKTDKETIIKKYVTDFNKGAEVL